MTELLIHNQNAVLFFPALLLTLWLTPWARKLSFRVNALDRPDERKVHRHVVSRLGGLAMVAGVAVPLLLVAHMSRALAGFLAGLLVVSVTGLLDDVRRIPAPAKFAGEVLAAAAFVVVGGVSLGGFGDILHLGAVRFGVLGPAATVFCMVGVMNAFNLSDGLDGLAGGISVIACAFLGIFAHIGRDPAAMAILVTVFGATLGFLRYNSYPAKLFMGDTGSLLLGYSLSAAAVVMAWEDGVGPQLAPVTVAAVLALPIVDTLLVMLRRIRHGGNPFLPDKTHLHHRLLFLGLPHSAVVTILYVSMAAFGLQAWYFRGYPEWIQFAAVIVLAGAVYGSVFLAQRFVARRPGRPAEAESPAAARKKRRVLASVLGKSVRPVGCLIVLALLLPAVALDSVPRQAGLIALACAGFVAALFPWRSGGSRSAICHGVLYLACASLLAILQVVPGSPPWIPGYLAALSALVLLWVLLKMRYRGHKEVILFSSFEILLIAIALFVPLVLVPALGLGAGLGRVLLTVCMESVAFLLAMKIFIRRMPGRNPVIAAGFLAVLAVIGARAFVATDPGSLLPPPLVSHAPVAPVVVRTGLRSS